MLEGLLSKVFGFLAREAVPFVLTIVVRNGIKKIEKKVEENHLKD